MRYIIEHRNGERTERRQGPAAHRALLQAAYDMIRAHACLDTRFGHAIYAAAEEAEFSDEVQSLAMYGSELTYWKES